MSRVEFKKNVLTDSLKHSPFINRCRHFVELKMPNICLGIKAVRKTKRNQPWWLEAGTEICPACSHAYVIQTEYRCVACDGPLCEMCVERTIAVEVFCPGCIPSATESEV
jgi:hypothetical protein